MPRRFEGFPEDRPWTEAEWERFMFEADVRSARFGDLLDTLQDHPDCDKIIEREMGWDFELSEEEGAELFAQQEAAAELAEEEDEFESEEIDFDEELPNRAVKSSPAYAHAFQWALQVHNALRSYLDQSDDADLEDPLMEAYANCTIVAAKIAGGQGMNRDGGDDTLCGNIVYCRKALAAATASLTGLRQAQLQNRAPQKVLTPLIAEAEVVCRLVEERIAEMRARVWWE